MDWFERLTGFREGSYEATRRQIQVEGRQLRSRVNGKGYDIGELELVSLQTLRERVQRSGGLPGKLKIGIVTGDVRHLHHFPEYEGALFQVASQFNLLEMVGPTVTPEDGVTRYTMDRTQGPACAIAAGAATVYRNYFAPVGNAFGQTSERQLDGLAEIGVALSEALNQPRETLWTMQNGYALCTQDGLEAINMYLRTLTPEKVDTLREKLRIGLHRDVEVTDVDREPRPHVSQAFCSALPVSYSRVPQPYFQIFASLILEAAYEATICAAVCNAQRGVSNVVLLTRLGGGAFGNSDDWIDAAIRRSLHRAVDFDLDVKLVTYGTPSRTLLEIVREFEK